MLTAPAAVQTVARRIELRPLDVPTTLAPRECRLRVAERGMCGRDAEQFRRGLEAYHIKSRAGAVSDELRTLQRRVMGENNIIEQIPEFELVGHTSDTFKSAKVRGLAPAQSQTL